jgi:cardiolipin synthase
VKPDEAGTSTSSGDESRIFTIPNILSFARLASVPFFIWLFVADKEEAAVILYGIGAWTDFFDGAIARRTNSVTELGRLLDPFADRVFIVALAVALVLRDALPLWLMITIVARDVAILVAFPLFESKSIGRIRVNFVGKTATAALLFGLTLLAYGETSFAGQSGTSDVGMGFVIFGAILYWVAAVMYARQAMDKLKPDAA